jgi:hypothetical protein
MSAIGEGMPHRLYLIPTYGPQGAFRPIGQCYFHVSRDTLTHSSATLSKMEIDAVTCYFDPTI